MGSVLVFNDFEIAINHAIIDVDIAVFATFLLRHLSGSSLVDSAEDSAEHAGDLAGTGLPLRDQVVELPVAVHGGSSPLDRELWGRW